MSWTTTVHIAYCRCGRGMHEREELVLEKGETSWIRSDVCDGCDGAPESCPCPPIQVVR